MRYNLRVQIRSRVRGAQTCRPRAPDFMIARKCCPGVVQGPQSKVHAEGRLNWRLGVELPGKKYREKMTPVCDPKQFESQSTQAFHENSQLTNRVREILGEGIVADESGLLRNLG